MPEVDLRQSQSVQIKQHIKQNGDDSDMVGELTDIIKCFSILSVLLLLGTFLRAKIKVFQKLFLPASVIGGALGLILGPEIAGDTLNAVFSPKTLSVCSAIPGILNLFIVSGIPLTLGKNKVTESKTGKN